MYARVGVESPHELLPSNRTRLARRTPRLGGARGGARATTHRCVGTRHSADPERPHDAVSSAHVDLGDVPGTCPEEWNGESLLTL
jgi:hypothetical protein